LKAIKDWYENTEEEYGFFCEDDLSLDTVTYWEFSWGDFIKNLPNDWQCVQLMCIRGEFDDIKLRSRYWDDWSATAYILKRTYAKVLIDSYIKEESYHLELSDVEVMPLIENILFASTNKCYTIPLFVENIDFKSTFEGDDDDVKDGQKRNHYFTHDFVLNWWKEHGNSTTIEVLMGNQMKTIESLLDVNDKTELEVLLTKYALDPENPEHNFNLGIWYEDARHNSAALSYFLRCAERTEDDLLAYESLIHASNAYERQGTRDTTSKGILQQALCIMPKRPEAYYLLARFTEKRECWQECYILCHWALEFCDFECESLKTDVLKI
jgi:tetratricopeptide (TPR) repeat protein